MSTVILEVVQTSSINNHCNFILLQIGSFKHLQGYYTNDPGTLQGHDKDDEGNMEKKREKKQGVLSEKMKRIQEPIVPQNHFMTSVEYWNTC